MVGFKLFLKTLIISVLCCVLFIGIGYSYLSSQINKPAENKVLDVPYSFTPENAGVLFNISGNKTLIYLNFEEKSVSIVAADTMNEQEKAVYGYPIDFTVEASYSLLSGIIDTVGGIELETYGEDLAYTGVQVVDILTTTPENKLLSKEIIQKILFKIAQNGFSSKDFLYIIENSNTNLTVPDCYYWQESMSEICKTVRFIG